MLLRKRENCSFLLYKYLTILRTKLIIVTLHYQAYYGYCGPIMISNAYSLRLTLIVLSKSNLFDFNFRYTVIFHVSNYQFSTSAIINVVLFIIFHFHVLEYVKMNLSNYNFNIAQISQTPGLLEHITQNCFWKARLTSRIFFSVTLLQFSVPFVVSVPKCLSLFQYVFKMIIRLLYNQPLSCVFILSPIVMAEFADIRNLKKSAISSELKVQ